MAPLRFTIATCLIVASTIGISVAVSSSFTCPGVGIYADPTNCHNFYTCDSSMLPVLGSCMGGNGTFDSVNKVCRVTPCSGPPATDPTSTNSTFVCPAIGLFADPSDCHSFYSCDQYLEPIPGTCLRGLGSFDPINKVCSSDPCTKTSPPETGDFVCVSEGYFADPHDCHAFYSCNNQLVPTHSTCTSNGYFDPDRICVTGTCEQPTTVTPTTEGYVCISSGFYADPKNCRGYYACDNALNSYHGICLDGNGYFDDTTRGCVIGDC